MTTAGSATDGTCATLTASTLPVGTLLFLTRVGGLEGFLESDIASAALTAETFPIGALHSDTRDAGLLGFLALPFALGAAAMIIFPTERIESPEPGRLSEEV